MNQRAFAEPPVYEVRGNKHVVILHMYHWCAHPAFGSSTHEFEFDTEADALERMARLGYKIVKD